MSRAEAVEFLVRKSIEFEEPVDLVVRTLATWEDGATAWPHAKYRRLLHKVTGRTAVELGFKNPAHRARPKRPVADAQHQAGAAPLIRRTFVLGTGAALLAAAAPAAHGAAPALTSEHLQALLDAEQRLYAQDRDHGSADLGQQATAALHTAHTWLARGRYSEHLGRQLHIATGMLSVAAGWLALDAGRAADARSLYTEALTSARQADDPGLEAHSFACMSLLAHATGRPREAVSTAQVAQRAAAGLGSPRWLALLALREARGWALQGDRAQAETAIVRAYRLYEKGPRDADPAWLAFFVTAELAGLESLCRADLGQHDRAAAGAEQTVMLFGDGHPRNRSLYTADIALHHAHRPRPDLDAATDAGHRALAHLTAVRSARLLRSLRSVAGTLTPHRGVPCVAEYLDAYRTAVPAA
ncbi:hypothetical protein [Kitasatospora sp. NA04385]|uniref:hypothetical protein n=1 Tax=Kitasatospora sp. NA04385 TaxID=2742135 RepID=UPI0020CAC8DD|nr:hypothetical protein [Kitasatospora sp. NA04385]